MIDKFKDSFKEEAIELLNSLEDSLLILEEHPQDKDAIAAVFRTMHTIKGSAGMFGFNHISSFTHEIENFMDDVRAGTIEVSGEMIDCTLSARDHIRNLLLLDQEVGPENEAISARIIDRFRILKPVPVKGADTKATDQPACPDGVPGNTLQTFRIRFEPGEDIMKNGTRPLKLIRELAAMGDISISSHPGKIPFFSDFNPESTYLVWDLMLTTRMSQDAIRDVFVFVEDNCRLKVELVDTINDDTEFRTPLGRILVDRGAVKGEAVEVAASSQKKIGSLLMEQGVPAEEVKAALEEQDHIKRTREKFAQEMSSSSIRVSSAKLDQLVDLVGELVTLQARLNQTSREIAHPVLTTISETLDRLANELRDNTMGVRMLPIGNNFSKFKRLVRDLSHDLGKNAEIQTEGGETELDKTVLEKLNDPLVHIIRNCIDHGLETPEQRKATGKPPVGTIRMAARHSGASVVIAISDDGRGIDLERVRQKAVERGLLSPQANPGRDELLAYILMPGFSTAREVSKVSGRGVGLDVVKKEIDALGGNLRIDTTPGAGTTMALEIPLTLAIIEGLLVNSGGEHYIFPLSTVVECLELTHDPGERQKISIDYRNAVLPLIYARDVLGIPGEYPGLQQIVVVNHQSMQVGVVVDSVIGDHQTVIKNLGKVYRDVQGISGATILGDGSVALIMDVPGLVQGKRPVRQVLE